MSKKLTPHTEDYLEIIYLLEKEHGHAHVRDIAKRLKIKMPSVTEAIGKLKKERLANYQKYGFINLTPKGSRLAQSVYKRHRILYRFLHDILGVEADTAEEDACKIEHVISRKTLKALEAFIKFVENRPRKSSN